VALLLRLQSYCENYDVPNSFDLYGLAAVAGDEAIPALRKIAVWPTDTPTGNYCERWVTAARIALAKLGDKKYRAALDEAMQGPQNRYLPLGDLGVVGDDRALRTLIEYLVVHANDPAIGGARPDCLARITRRRESRSGKSIWSGTRTGSSRFRFIRMFRTLI
jgi:hypothetical protein